MKKFTDSVKLMGTDIILEIYSNKISTVKKKDIYQACFGEFQRIVDKFTRFNNSSELSKLNLNSGNFHKVDKEFFLLLKYMYSLYIQTEGLFDPSVIDYLEIIGYGMSLQSENDMDIENNLIKRFSSRPSFGDIAFIESDYSVKLPRDVRVDLGSIGKGYAIDCAFEKIINIDPTIAFLINAGGDIRVNSNLEKISWNIELKSKNKTEGYIELKDSESICSSGSWIKKIGKYNHLINPKNLSFGGIETTFVKAKKAMEADAWATIIFLGGQKFIRDEDIEYFEVKEKINN